MHMLQFLRRRFPIGYPVIVSLLFLVSLAVLVLGIGLLFVR
jgi:hypothetical protein